jgi:ankyrin repeat protein
MFWPNDKTQQDVQTEGARSVSIYQAGGKDGLARVTELLDSGVEIDDRDESLRTALHWAVINNNSAMVQLLLSHGADTNLRDDGTFDEPEGFTPVESAARLNAISAMQEFIAHGVTILNSKSLCLAAREGHMDMLQLLFNKHSNDTSKGHCLQAIADALCLSAKNQSVEMVRFVVRELQRAPFANTHNDDWQDILNRAFLAVFMCDDVCDGECDQAIRITDILLEAGASIDTHADD